MGRQDCCLVWIMCITPTNNFYADSLLKRNENTALVHFHSCAMDNTNASRQGAPIKQMLKHPLSSFYARSMSENFEYRSKGWWKLCENSPGENPVIYSAASSRTLKSIQNQLEATGTAGAVPSAGCAEKNMRATAGTDAKSLPQQDLSTTRTRTNVKSPPRGSDDVHNYD